MSYNYDAEDYPIWPQLDLYSGVAWEDLEDDLNDYPGITDIEGY